MLKTIRIDRLDLGTVPPRVDCFKSFETGEDELIIEVGQCLAYGVYSVGGLLLVV